MSAFGPMVRTQSLVRALLLLSAALLLVGCARGPVKPEAPVSNWSLANTKTVGIHFQEEPVQAAIGFNTKGYTIFGVLYVGAAAKKMSDQTAELRSDLAAYLKAHPEVLSLEETFRQEVESQLRAKGVEPIRTRAVRQMADKKVTYSLEAAESKAPVTVVIDFLMPGYFAPSATHHYNPRSATLLTVLDMTDAGKQLLQKGVQEESNVGSETEYAYENFAAVKQNLPQAYEGLQRSVRRLAGNVVAALVQKP